jgi:hypothetical protein
MSKYIPKEKRLLVKNRANNYCEYCFSKEEFSPSSFAIEHIIPIAKNGTDDSDNLAYSCQGCNNFKYINTTSIDSLTGEVVPLFNPRSDKWIEHFKWSKDTLTLIGLSPRARATIDLLKLNRQSVVNLRRAIKSINEHPPSHLK